MEIYKKEGKMEKRRRVKNGREEKVMEWLECVARVNIFKGN